MQDNRQGLTWYNALGPLLLLAGLLVLEEQASLSPAGHRIAVLVIALLMYCLVLCQPCHDGFWAGTA
jgi:hypothetical protein